MRHRSGEEEYQRYRRRRPTDLRRRNMNGFPTWLPAEPWYSEKISAVLRLFLLAAVMNVASAGTRAQVLAPSGQPTPK